MVFFVVFDIVIVNLLVDPHHFLCLTAAQIEYDHLIFSGLVSKPVLLQQIEVNLKIRMVVNVIYGWFQYFFPEMAKIIQPALGNNAVMRRIRAKYAVEIVSLIPGTELEVITVVVAV